jgi:thiamine kinase-like enzyme
MRLKQALVRMPGLAADSVVSMLSDGPTNTSYLVRRGEELCVLRLDKPLASELGLDRAAEHDIIETTSLAGIGGRPLHFDPDNGISLRQYLPGRPWLETDLQDAGNLKRLASRLRDLHALPPIGNSFEPGRAARRYAQHLGTAEARQFADTANLLLAELHYDQARECLCHNDLVAGNIVEGSDGLFLIDWEYAGLGDPWFDLALVVEHHELDDGLQAGFVFAYLQREPREQEMKRLLAWRRFYRALLSLWRLRTEGDGS